MKEQPMSVSKKMVEFAERSSWIRKMFEEGGKMKAEFGAENVFDFSLGNPDLSPPPQFKDALSKVVAAEGPGVHSYMPNGGYLHVRDAVAAQMSGEQGITLSGNELLLTCGAAGGLNVVMKALLDPGDEVIILNPFFVEYKFYVDNHGGVTRVVETDSEFDLDLAAIEEALTDKTKAFIINSPNNPTGQIYSAESLAALGNLLETAGNRFGTTIYLIADEPYRKIVFDDYEVPSIMQAYRNSLVVSSYSKDLSLPGERIGYIAVHPEAAAKQQLLDAMTLANRILGFVNAPALMQRVIGELQGVTVDCSIYTRRREKFCAVLKDAGYEFMPPKGAFYIFPKSPLQDEVEFVSILRDNKILAVPGRGFGSPGYFRLAFCVEDSVIERSAAAFAKAMETALNRGQ
jgi:aspartate aminotransferase